MSKNPLHYVAVFLCLYVGQLAFAGEKTKSAFDPNTLYDDARLHTGEVLVLQKNTVLKDESECYHQRNIYASPKVEMVTYVAVRFDQLQVSNIKKCIKGLRGNEFRTIIVQDRDIQLTSLQEARTKHFSCTIFETKDRPRFYSIRFSQFKALDTSKELRECIKQAQMRESSIGHIWEKK